jgi:hypothetical protein
MLGRKDYTAREVESAKAAVAQQLATYRALLAATKGGADARKAFEPVYANAALLALDRRFVHRVRVVAGKDGHPLNELELVVESLLDHGGVFHTNNVIKYVAAESVLGLQPGEQIQPTIDDVERFAKAFFAELEARFGS